MRLPDTARRRFTGESSCTRALFSAFLGLAVTTASSWPAAAAITFTPSCFANHLSVGEVAADFNEDGRMDVALSTASAPPDGGTLLGLDLEVYLGHGDGTFGPATTLKGASTIGFTNFIAADANHDGHVDLVAANGQGFVSVFEGRGDGTFASRKNYGAGKSSEGVTVGDFNGDGRADLASADPADAAVVVLLGTGQGGSFKSRVLYPSGFPNRAITTADLNGDGRLDLVTANAAANGGPGGTTLSVLLGNGDGTFQPFTVVSLPRFTGRAIAAADFDHDGRMDLALGTQSFSTSGILTLKGNGDGTFAPAFYYPTSSNAPNLSATLYFTLGDLNGDGRPDVVAGNRRFDANFVQTGADITVLLDQPDGSLVNSGTTAVHFAEGLAVADFDSNGLPDVASDDCIQLQNASPTPAAVTALLSPAGGGSVAPRLAVSFAPNPWRDAGAVTFVLARTGRVSLGLYDLNGRRVASLLDGARLEAGEHRVAIARRPEGVGPGVYFYRLWTETGSATARAVLTAR